MLPDHIVALQSAVDNRIAEALAFGAAKTAEASFAWFRVAMAQDSLNAALAAQMLRALPVVR